MGRNQAPEATNEPRVNRRIRVPRVLVIDEAGNKLGEFLTEDAIRLAEERGLDLVEVAPTARPPVCKITDFGKMKYEKKKREQESRRNQVQVVLKEIKLRPKTEEADLGVKLRAARAFLEDGNKVKFTVTFRGRELAHREIGQQQCQHMADALKEMGVIETPPRMDGPQMFMVLAPTKRPTVRPRPRREEEQREIDAAIAAVESEAGREDDLVDDASDVTAQLLNEFRLSPDTAQQDLDAQIGVARGFLQQGNKVTFTVPLSAGRKVDPSVAQRVLALQKAAGNRSVAGLLDGGSDQGASAQQQLQRTRDALKDVGMIATRPHVDAGQIVMGLQPLTRSIARPRPLAGDQDNTGTGAVKGRAPRGGKS